MQRYLLLLALSLTSLVVLHQYLRNDLLADVLVPKERPYQILVAILLIAVTSLWAGMVEWLLRRFVDRPKDSDAE